MSTKRSRRDRPLLSSSEEEDHQAKWIEGCPVLLGKNIDLASFTFNAPSFYIEDLFSTMGSILTLHDKVYPSIVKDFYKKMVFSPGTGILCLVWNKRIKITQELIRSILHLEDGGIILYTTKTILHLEEYNSVEACRRVTGKHFNNPARLSTNQLTLTCRVFHNIITHIIVPRKGHLDEVNHYDVFLLDSILIGQKLDFSYVMLHHMDLVLSGTRTKALPYGMIFTKKFQYFEISFRDSVSILPKATDTINTSTLKCMKIFKEDGQWVAKSNGFDDESGPSTLSFEDGKEMDDDEDEPPPRPRSQRPSSSTSEFTKDHFNLLNGRIDSLTSSVEGLHNTAEDLHHTIGTLQHSIDGMTSLLHALHSRLAPCSLRILYRKTSLSHSSFSLCVF
ncbi:Uncharacterized protein Adt_27439 [Abeliophyllum distichum]|uniref:Putative plant transposon protein domain-containing protein n=1 Tax=Abeliophyllum distichum TaxID=126358 RepID=A0ABD1RTR1_9LAMI